METCPESSRVSEPKSLTAQDSTVCAWTMTNVLLKIGFGRTGVKMAGKQVTLDHAGNAAQLCLL